MGLSSFNPFRLLMRRESQPHGGGKAALDGSPNGMPRAEPMAADLTAPQGGAGPASAAGTDVPVAKLYRKHLGMIRAALGSRS